MDRSREFVLNQLPLITTDRRLAGLILRSDLVAEEHLPISAVIMAGGFGTRMRPLTDTVPKPMLPVGGRPLLAVTIERLREAGIRNVNVTTHYLADEIKSYFGDGSGFGVSLGYVDEGQPLGTAGGLNLAPETDQPLFVINGDVLTGVNFRDMLGFHKKHGADLTVGVRRYDVAVPYGVLECDGPRVREVREKPEMHLLINAGMYLLEPSVRRYIPEGRRFDMTDLIQELLAGRPGGRELSDRRVLAGRRAAGGLREGADRRPEGEARMNVLVTGGAGYVGSMLVPVLLERGDRVRVLDCLLHGGDPLLSVWAHPNFEFVHGDVCDPATVRSALTGVDAVVHLAAIVGDPACARQPDRARAVNLDASLALLEESRRAGV